MIPGAPCGCVVEDEEIRWIIRGSRGGSGRGDVPRKKTNKGGGDQKKRQRNPTRRKGEIKGCRGQVVRKRSCMPGAQSGGLGMPRFLGIPEWLCIRDLLIVSLKYRGRGDDVLSRLHRVSIL